MCCVYIYMRYIHVYVCRSRTKRKVHAPRAYVYDLTLLLLTIVACYFRVRCGREFVMLHTYQSQRKPFVYHCLFSLTADNGMGFGSL